MAEEFKIFGKNLGQEDRDAVKKHYEQLREAAIKPMEGEMGKNEEEIRFINKLDSCLKQEFERLGIGKKPDILPERIHFITHDAFVKIENYSGDQIGKFSPTENTVVIDRERVDKRMTLFELITHETLHLLSCQKIKVDVSETEIETEVYRIGYAIDTRLPEQDRPFHEFNEAVTEIAAHEIFAANSEDLNKEFNFDEEEKHKVPLMYSSLIKIVQEIIEKISEKKNEKPRMIWDRIEKGYFTGEMMHLRDVDKVFGKGSLRVLAAFDFGLNENFPKSELYKKTSEYFETESIEERDKLAKEILNEQERLRYEQIKNQKQTPTETPN